MKKKVLLAVILSMLAVASTGCTLVEDITDTLDSFSTSSKDNRDEDDVEDEEEDKDEESKDIDEDKDKDKDEDSDDKSSLSNIINFNKNNADEEPSEEVIVEPATSIVEATEAVDTENEPTELSEKPQIAQNNILYDDAGLKITYNNISKEFDLLRFNMTFENSSDIPLVVQAWEVYINGKEVDAIMSVGTEVGNTIEDAMKFYIDDLKELGIEIDDIETVEVSFHIFDWDGKVESVDTELIKFQA